MEDVEYSKYGTDVRSAIKTTVNLKTSYSLMLTQQVDDTHPPGRTCDSKEASENTRRRDKMQLPKAPNHRTHRCCPEQVAETHHDDPILDRNRRVTVDSSWENNQTRNFGSNKSWPKPRWESARDLAEEKGWACYTTYLLHHDTLLEYVSPCEWR